MAKTLSKTIAEIRKIQKDTSSVAKTLELTDKRASGLLQTYHKLFAVARDSGKAPKETLEAVEGQIQAVRRLRSLNKQVANAHLAYLNKRNKKNRENLSLLLKARKVAISNVVQGQAGLRNHNPFFKSINASSISRSASSRVGLLKKIPSLSLPKIPKGSGKISSVLNKVGKSAAFAGSRVGRLAGVLEGLGLASGAAAAVAGVLAAAMVGVGVAVAGTIKWYSTLINTMKTSESQIIRLQTAFQDQTKAVLEYQKAIEFAGKTPFSVSGVVEATAVLRTFQFDPFSQSLKSGRSLMELLGDMAGATGVDLATAVHALQRAQVGEFEILQNNFQISGKMITKLKGLRSGTKEYGEAIVEMLDKQQRFVGGQLLMAKSILGMVSNIRDATDKVLIFAAGVADSKGILEGATMYDAFRNSLRKVYDTVTDASVFKRIKEIDRLMAKGANIEQRKEGAAQLARLIEQLGGGDAGQAKLAKFRDIMKSTKSEVQQMALASKQGLAPLEILTGKTDQLIRIGQVLGQISKVFFEVFGAPLFDAFAGFIDFVVSGFNQIMDSILPMKQLMESVSLSGKDSAQSVSKAIKASLKESEIAILRQGGDLMDFSAMVQKRLQKQSIGALTGFQKFILGFSILMEFVKLFILDTFKPIIKMFRFVAKVFVATFITTIVGYLSYVAGAFWGYFGEINDALKGFMSDPDVQRLVKWFKQLFGVTDEKSAQKGFISFLQLVAKWAFIVGKYVGKFMASGIRLTLFLLKWLIKGIFWLKDNGPGLWEAFKAGAESLWEAVKSGAKATWDFIKAVFFGIGDAIKFLVLLPIRAFVAVWKLTAKTGRFIWDVFVKAFNAVWVRLKKMFSLAWDAIKTIGNLLFNIFVKPLSIVWKQIKSLGRAIANVFLRAFGPIFSSIWNAIQKINDAIFNVFSNTFSPVFSAIGDVLNKIGRSIYDTLSSAFSAVWGQLKAGGIAAVRAVVRFLKNTLGFGKDGFFGKAVNFFKELFRNSKEVSFGKGRAIGSAFVKKDQIAPIHKGEMIIPAGEAQALRSGIVNRVLGPSDNSFASDMGRLLSAQPKQPQAVEKEPIQQNITVQVQLNTPAAASTFMQSMDNYDIFNKVDLMVRKG